VAQEGRLRSLDVFRGLTIAGMIVVNTPGNESPYAPLEHADWHGCTPTDLVFPFFLFIVGTAIVFALARRKDEGGPRRELILGILRRTAVLFGLGLFLNAIPNYHPSSIRLPGVLQRIALCYLAGSLVFLWTGLRAQVALAAALLAGYWLLMTRVPVPGFGPGDLGKEGNLAACIDRLVFGPHTYRHGVFDPEGLLSTMGAVATTLLGIFAGLWLKAARPPRDKAAGLVIAGTAAAVAGGLWALWFPLNKALWTSSYVLYTGGLAAFTLAACYWLVDMKGRAGWALPFEALGVNAITAYVLPILLLKALVLTKVAGPAGAPIQLRIWLCDRLFGSWLAPANASLAFSLAYLSGWTVVFRELHRRKVVFKV